MTVQTCLVLTGLAGIVACAAVAPQPRPSGVIVVGVTRVPDWIAPLSAPRGPVEQLMVSMLYSGLFSDRTDSAEAAPALAAGLPVGRDEDLKVFTIELRPGAAWSDGRDVTTGDVMLSWHVLRDYPNDFPQRATLLAMVRDIDVDTDGCDRCLRVVTEQSMTPDDLAGFLTFPVLPAHAVHLVAPDPGQLSQWIDDRPGHPVGAGAFAVEGELDSRVPAVLLRGPPSGPMVVLRRLPTAEAQQAALDNEELDLLIEPDSGLMIPSTSRLRRLEGSRDFRIALVLNPARGQMVYEAERRTFLQRIAASLPTAQSSGCRSDGRLAGQDFRILMTESTPMMATAVARLRTALACLGHKLVVSRHAGGSLAPGGTYDGVLASVGDETADLARIGDLLWSARILDYREADSLHQVWLNAPRRKVKESVRLQFFAVLDSAAAVTYIASRRQAMLASPALSSARIGPDGALELWNGWR